MKHYEDFYKDNYDEADAIERNRLSKMFDKDWVERRSILRDL